MLYVVIGFYSSRIVLVCKRPQGNVVVEEVLLAGIRELAQVFLEGGGVVIYVKGKFGVVEIRVFLDLSVVGLGGGLLECGQYWRDPA